MVFMALSKSMHGTAAGGLIYESIHQWPRGIDVTRSKNPVRGPDVPAGYFLHARGRLEAMQWGYEYQW